MGKIVELRPQNRAPPPISDQPGPARTSIEEATSRLMLSVGDLIAILEASHRRIRALIDTLPDADAAARLARDHAELSDALQDAKLKVGAFASSPDDRAEP